ncbi:hypothetical protein FSP39_001508 [Pinctada imbricata]|uniref:RING-type domain-containing protein n=1 Tax=Pinctada imbricata TaxID=66713 RepID=A0AA89C897_PINIB|nr:hypothetical protein FSP39_001508 [Pinctada imbricata]
MAIPYNISSDETDKKTITAENMRGSENVMCSTKVDKKADDLTDEKDIKENSSTVVSLATELVMKTFCDIVSQPNEKAGAMESCFDDGSEKISSFKHDTAVPERILMHLSSACSKGINIAGKLGSSSAETLKNILCNMDNVPRQPSTSINVYPIFGLKEYYQELEKNPDLPIQQRMKCDLVRCASFSSYPNSEISSMSLSKAGFYYEGNVDEVKCFECGLKHKHWTKGDDPFEIHLRMSPECSFIKNVAEEIDRHRQIDNQPSTSTQSIHSSSQLTSQQNASDITGTSIGVSSVASSPVQPQGSHSSNENDLPSSTRRPQHSRDPVTNMTGQRNDGSQNISTVSRYSNSPSGTDRSQTPRRPSQITSQAITSPAVSAPAPKKSAAETLEPLGISIEKPKYPQYAVMATRLSSFRHWPKHKKQCPETLAKAGFVYEGTEDFTRCFFCGGGLREWEDEDDPWVEHARWYPKCVYIRQCKGDKYVQDIIEGKPLERVENECNEEPLQRNLNTDEILMLPAVQSVIEMGYGKEIVLRAVKVKMKEQDIKYVSAETLLQKAWDMEETGNQNKDKADDSETIEGATGVSTPENNREETKEEFEALLEENRHLKDQQICKICMDDPISIVFLPCGHMVTCGNCAPAMRKCPLCRRFIKGTVKAILS